MREHPEKTPQKPIPNVSLGNSGGRNDTCSRGEDPGPAIVKVRIQRED